MIEEREQIIKIFDKSSEIQVRTWSDSVLTFSHMLINQYKL